MTARDWLLDLLFPPKCPFCGRVRDRRGICPDCRRDLPWTEDPDQVQTLPGGLRCTAPLWYEDLARDGLLRFKFGGAASAAEELGERLTMLGLELEEVVRPYEGIKDVVLGRVLTCDMHPDSDHLHVTTVDVGQGEPLTIVCGAPNVAAGQKVIVAGGGHPAGRPRHQKGQTARGALVRHDLFRA